MPRCADQLRGQFQRHPQPWILEIEVELLGLLLRHAIVTPAPDETGQAGCHILRQAHDLADFPHGATGSIGDHHSGQGSTVPAIGVVDPLDHLLPPLVLKIHIDVRRLAPFLGHEALEQEIVLDRVD